MSTTQAPFKSTQLDATGEEHSTQAPNNGITRVELLAIRIEQLNLTKSIIDALNHECIRTVGDIVGKTDLYMIGILNLRARDIVAIDDCLEKLGITRVLV